MVLERGPEGKLHAPAYRSGCYYERLSDCCLLCMGRIGLSSTTSPVRYRFRDAQRDDDHDLLGERVVVPYVDDSSHSTGLDYREGTVSDVHVRSGDDPDLLTVKISEGEYVHLNLAPDERPEVAGIQSD